MSLSPAIRTGSSIRHARFAVPLCLAGLMLLALILRLISIDSRTLWGDEAWRVLAARQDTLWDTLRVVWSQPPSAPLYWLGLHVWVELFGHGDVAVRLFSVIPSVASIPGIYALGKSVAGDRSRTVGLVAALLLAVSPLAVEVGEEATMYAWTMLFATLALWRGITLLRSGGSIWPYVAAATLLLYTHYMGGLLLVEMLVIGLVWLGRSRRDSTTAPVTMRAAWVWAHVLMALIWAPWLVSMGVRLYQRWDELSHLQHRAGLTELYGLATNLTVSASAAANWPRVFLVLAVGTGIGLALIALFGRKRDGDNYLSNSAARALAALVLGFVVFIVAVSAVTGAWLVQPRFLALVVTPALVVIAAGAVLFRSLPLRAPLRLLSLALSVIWVVTQVGGVADFYANPVHGHDGVREISAELNADVRPGDLVLSNHALLPWSIAQYYSGPIQSLPENRDIREGYLLWPTPDLVDFAPPQIEVLQGLLEQRPSRVWLLYLPVMDPHGSLLSTFQSQYSQLEIKHYAFCDLYLFTLTSQ